MGFIGSQKPGMPETSATVTRRRERERGFAGACARSSETALAGVEATPRRSSAPGQSRTIMSIPRSAVPTFRRRVPRDGVDTTPKLERIFLLRLL